MLTWAQYDKLIVAIHHIYFSTISWPLVFQNLSILPDLLHRGEPNKIPPFYLIKIEIHLFNSSIQLTEFH